MVMTTGYCCFLRRGKASADMSAVDTLPMMSMPAYVHCRPGETISHPRPGDIILVRHKHWLGWLVRCFVRIRHRAPEDRPYTYWTHAALVVSHTGKMVEVNARGVVISHIWHYRESDYHYVWLDRPAAGHKPPAHSARPSLKKKYGRPIFLPLGPTFAFGDPPPI